MPLKHLRDFILSEGKKYRDLQPDNQDVSPSKAPGSPEDGLDGWTYMMRTQEKDFALLYFEDKSVLPVLSNFIPNADYYFRWYNTINGSWMKKIVVRSDDKGNIKIPNFPDGHNPSPVDWAARIVKED